MGSKTEATGNMIYMRYAGTVSLKPPATIFVSPEVFCLTHYF